MTPPPFKKAISLDFQTQSSQRIVSRSKSKSKPRRDREIKMKSMARSIDRSPAYLSELRLERSWAAIGFSEPCPCCGNKKRRSLHPPPGSRKKLLVLDPPNPTSSPSPISPAGPGVSPSPTMTSPSPCRSPFFARSSSFPSAGEVFQSPPPLPRAPVDWEPISPMSPPKFPAPEVVPSPAGEQRLERSGSSAMEEPHSGEKAVSCLRGECKKEGGASREEEESVTEEQLREEVRVSVSCRCGVVREVVIHR